MNYEFQYAPRSDHRVIVCIPIVVSISTDKFDDWELVDLSINGVQVDLAHPLSQAVIAFADSEGHFDAIDGKLRNRHGGKKTVDAVE